MIVNTDTNNVKQGALSGRLRERCRKRNGKHDAYVFAKIVVRRTRSVHGPLRKVGKETKNIRLQVQEQNSANFSHVES